MKLFPTIFFLISVTYRSESANRPVGIFIQVSTAKTWVLPNLARWLDNICARNRQLPVHERMNDLILQDVASEAAVSGCNYTMHFGVLDVIAPYFPGGTKHCFGNVFVGTIEVAWKGEGNMYFDGIKNAPFRQRNLDLSAQVAREFKNRYKNTHLNWYVTYEANLNYLTDEHCMLAYSDYLSRLVRTFTSIQRGSVVWSPAFWNTWDETVANDVDKLRANLNALFTTVQQNSPPGINWMNLQDSLGKASGPGCTGLKTKQTDAIQLFQFLKSVFNFVSMQMNIELFVYNENCQLVQNDANIQIQREEIYRSNGVPAGASWDIRFWREK